MKKTLIILMALLSGIYANAQTWDIGTPNAADVKTTLSNDTLHIVGTGNMQDFSSGALGGSPWYSLNNSTITTVIIEAGVTNIGKHAFADARKVTSVSIPNTVTEIRDAAFFACRGLTSVVIPASVTIMTGQAFAYTDNLKDVTILSKIPPTIHSNTMFGNTNISSAILTVACGSLTAYQNNDQWKNFGKIVEEECPKAGVSNVKANFSCPGKVTVTYCLNTANPTDVTLYYSPDGGKTWLIAQTVTGDLTAQTTGTGKTIVWDNRADHVRWGNFKLKVDVPKVEPVPECGTVKSSLPVGQLTFLCYNLGANPNMSVEEQMNYTAYANGDFTVYGSLYQWGRQTDGHERRSSWVSPFYAIDFANALDANGQIKSTHPAYGNYIRNDYTLPYDWRDPQCDTLWGATKTINDPCPEGYRIPTQAEWESIFDAASGNTKAWNSSGTPGYKISPDGGKNYTLFLPGAGIRYSTTSDQIRYVGEGYYWTSSVSGNKGVSFQISSYGGFLSSSDRSSALSCRCVKEY
jgi:uncharacterized protein (TIGR02145 family)